MWWSMRPAFSSRTRHRVAWHGNIRAGKITNCQIGVFASYVSWHGYAFVGRAVYLPKGINDPARCKATHVPAEVEFSTKPQLAAAMLSAQSCRRSSRRFLGSTNPLLSKNRESGHSAPPEAGGRRPSSVTRSSIKYARKPTFSATQYRLGSRPSQT